METKAIESAVNYHIRPDDEVISAVDDFLRGKLEELAEENNRIRKKLGSRIQTKIYHEDEKTWLCFEMIGYIILRSRIIEEVQKLSAGARKNTRNYTSESVLLSITANSDVKGYLGMRGNSMDGYLVANWCLAGLNMWLDCHPEIEGYKLHERKRRYTDAREFIINAVNSESRLFSEFFEEHPDYDELVAKYDIGSSPKSAFQPGTVILVQINVDHTEVNDNHTECNIDLSELAQIQAQLASAVEDLKNFRPRAASGRSNPDVEAKINKAISAFKTQLKESISELDDRFLDLFKIWAMERVKAPDFDDDELNLIIDLCYLREKNKKLGLLIPDTKDTAGHSIKDLKEKSLVFGVSNRNLEALVFVLDQIQKFKPSLIAKHVACYDSDEQNKVLTTTISQYRSRQKEKLIFDKTGGWHFEPSS